MSMERTSASRPSSTPQWKYDVFLSFRGDDTRKHFTDHLFTALESHGVRTFKDDPELQKGKVISLELFTAIEKSRFALIVLSANYASSKWCLDELVHILECMETRETVLPIFYNVHPSDVRKQTGSFAEAFTKHEENLRDDTEKVRRWRDALTKVANFSGWDSKDWFESKLIKDIVEVVWKKLRPTLLSRVDNLVGIDSRLKPINLFLDANVDDVSFIGIWGMGGIGKTTIARVLYKTISHGFEYKIFLANVRKNSEETGLPHLQKQLLSHIGSKVDDIGDIHEGATMIRRFLCGKKVLLILDDVNHLDQLESLAGKQEWFGLGSKVFITTRYESLLIKHGVERRFEVEELNDDEALKLFSLKAFQKEHPKQSYVGLCNRVVDYAKGLPLAVKVLGAFLHGRDLVAWKSALDKLKEVCNSDILETLKISYDGLEYDEKKIFLDIACFFKGECRNRVRKILNAYGSYADIGIDVLVEKSLLTITNNTLSMHDLLQEMGREIVRRESPDQPGKRSRLWNTKDLAHVLSKNTATEAIEGIIVDQVVPGVLHANAKSFVMMNKLRYLRLNNVDLSNGLEYLPISLRILEWPQFPLKSLPSSYNPEDLVELNMCHSRIEHLWKGIEPLYHLKTIKLSHSSLIKIPDFRIIPFLEHLILEGCTRLYEVDSARVLKRLTLMNLKDCKNLVRLPSSVSGLKSLKVLNVSGCSKLEKLPEDLGHVECLEELDVSGTAIIEPPSSIRLLKKLKAVALHGCKLPSSKPWDIMLFPFRSLLKVRQHPTTLWLPSLFGVHSLTDLDLSDSNLLEGVIPNDLGCMSSLRYLDLSRNQFVSLPRSICQLSRLSDFDVSNCYRLQTLPELPSSICFVKAYNSNSLEISGPDLVKLFTNCFKEVDKQGCISVEFTGHRFDFLAPGNEIPKWFNHKSVGSSSVSVELHPGWFSHKWVGFALCVVFGYPYVDYIDAFIFGQLTVNGEPLNEVPPIMCGFRNFQGGSDHVWLCYLPRHEFSYQWKNGYTRLEFSFSSLASIGEVKKCGVRIVYEEDAEEIVKQTYMSQIGVSICDEFSESPDSNFEKAAAVSASVTESGCIDKRGVEHCDDEEGPPRKRSKQHCYPYDLKHMNPSGSKERLFLDIVG